MHIIKHSLNHTPFATYQIEYETMTSDPTKVITNHTLPGRNAQNITVAIISLNRNGTDACNYEAIIQLGVITILFKLFSLEVRRVLDCGHYRTHVYCPICVIMLLI